MSDNPLERRNDRLDAALNSLRSAVVPTGDMGAESLQATIDALDVTVVPPSWWGTVAPIALISTTLPAVETRSATLTAPLLEVVQADLPPDFDPQIYITATDGHYLTVEIEVEPLVGDLWAAITIAGEPLVSPFEESESPRLREARLPLPASRPITIEIVRAPDLGT